MATIDETGKASSTPLEEYALLSDLRTGPLVSRDGSIDWLCFPDFDSPAVFSAILGDANDGRWRLRARDAEVESRAYRPGTFVLQTTWRTASGVAVVTDLLPAGNEYAKLIRHVECTEGSVVIENDVRIRPDYNRSGAWIRRERLDDGSDAMIAIAGPEMLVLRGPLLLSANGDRHEADSCGEVCDRLEGEHPLSAGESMTWTLTWCKSWQTPPQAIDPVAAIADTEKFWRDWGDQLEVENGRDAMVKRSLLVLRALTHAGTGGIVAAPTASLPEEFGGSRNWDYRYTWLRDAALTIEAMVLHGYTDGAKTWRDWLLRAVAGDPGRLQIMYGIDGRRHLPEAELPHLAGYENSRPVRIGNGAVDQYQADVAGEVMIALADLRDAGEPEDQWSWGLQRHLLRFCAENVDRQDHGIWEMRGDLAYFTHGRVMMWAAFNEGLRAVAEHGGDCVTATDEEIELWTRLRDRLYDEIHESGWNEELGSFVQTYAPSPGFWEVDASLLQLPHTKFIAADDPRMLGTLARIEKDLVDEAGFIHRYRTASGMDGLDGDEYPFLICMGWLAEQYADCGRLDDAEKILDLLDDCAGELGLLAEEYDPVSGRLAGNYPQAFSHLGYVRAADAINRNRGA